MDAVIGLGLYYVGIIVLIVIYVVRQRRKRIANFEEDISELRQENGMLKRENQRLNELAHKNIIRKRTEMKGIDIENYVVITNPDEMDKFAREIDGWMCNSISLKVVIDKQKKEMFDSILKFLSLTKPSMQEGNSFR